MSPTEKPKGVFVPVKVGLIQRRLLMEGQQQIEPSQNNGVLFSFQRNQLGWHHVTSLPLCCSESALSNPEMFCTRHTSHSLDKAASKGYKNKRWTPTSRTAEGLSPFQCMGLWVWTHSVVQEKEELQQRRLELGRHQNMSKPCYEIVWMFFKWNITRLIDYSSSSLIQASVIPTSLHIGCCQIWTKVDVFLQTTQLWFILRGEWKSEPHALSIRPKTTEKCQPHSVAGGEVRSEPFCSGQMDICTKCNGNLFNIHTDTLVWTTEPTEPCHEHGRRRTEECFSEKKRRSCDIDKHLSKGIYQCKNRSVLSQLY